MRKNVQEGVWQGILHIWLSWAHICESEYKLLNLHQ